MPHFPSHDKSKPSRRAIAVRHIWRQKQTREGFELESGIYAGRNEIRKTLRRGLKKKKRRNAQNNRIGWEKALGHWSRVATSLPKLALVFFLSFILSILSVRLFTCAPILFSSYASLVFMLS